VGRLILFFSLGNSFSYAFIWITRVMDELEFEISLD